MPILSAPSMWEMLDIQRRNGVYQLLKAKPRTGWKRYKGWNNIYGLVSDPKKSEDCCTYLGTFDSVQKCEDAAKGFSSYWPVATKCWFFLWCIFFWEVGLKVSFFESTHSQQPLNLETHLSIPEVIITNQGYVWHETADPSWLRTCYGVREPYGFRPVSQDGVITGSIIVDAAGPINP